MAQDTNPTSITPGALTAVLAVAGLLAGAMIVDAALVGWMLGDTRVLGMCLGAAVGALWARVIVLERRIRALDADRTPAQAGTAPATAEAPVVDESAETEFKSTRPAAPDDSRTRPDSRSPPEPERSPSPLRGLATWFTEGNLPVKIGLAVLLVGVAASLRYATEQGWLSAPIELRLAAVALAAVAALAFAWRERHRRRVFAVSLQGGAIGVLALTVFAALRLYQVLPTSAAFVLLIVLVGTAAVLAVVQRALVLAVLGLITGFAAPILVSTGAGNHVVLFAWYGIVNLAMLGIARYRDWPLLYRLGFGFTFLIGSAWGVLRYDPSQFFSAQAFLTLFFLLYFLVPVLVELRRPRSERSRVDAVLVFGLPLFWLPLQAGLLEADRPAIAAAALAAAGVYLAGATWLLRRRGILPLGRAHATLAIALATVAVPFAFAETTVVSIWALEGAALVWFGLADNSRRARLAGLALMSLALLIWLVVLAIEQGDGRLLLNAAFVGTLALAAATAVSAWRYHDAGASSLLVNLLALAALVAWTMGSVAEIERNIPTLRAGEVLLVWSALTAAVLALAHRLRPWPVTALGGVAALGLGAPLAFHQAELHEWPWGGYGGLAWIAFLALAWLARRQLDAAHLRWQALAALAVQASLAVMFALVLVHGVDALPGLTDGWRVLAGALPLLLLVAWLQADGIPLPGPRLPAGRERSWPLDAAHAVAVLGIVATLGHAGDPAPLVFVPLLNPLELAQAVALLLLARGLRAPLLPWVAGLATATVTAMALRAVHHLADVAWSAPALLASETAQATLTVTWTLLGVVAWVLGSKRGLRGLWLAGALILGMVLTKLLLIDRDYLSNVAGIVSFLGFGLLSVLVGYLAPAPPRVGHSPGRAST